MKQAKVMLINPSHQPKDFPKKLVGLSRHSGTQIEWHQDFPFDLAYISAMLKKKEIECIIWDEHSLDISRKKTLEKIREFEPDFIGIETDSVCNWGCPVPTIEHAEKLAEEIKKEGIESKIIAMGPQLCTPINKFRGADVIIKNEFEKVFVETIKNFNFLEKVKGIIYFKKGERIENLKAEPLDLSELPVPDYSSVELGKYNIFKIEYSRGCPFNCIYCFKGVVGKIYREKKIKNLMKEIKILVPYKKKFIFQDALFPYNELKSLCKALIKEKLGIEYEIQTRADLLNKESLGLLKKSGCKRIAVGLESFSDEILLKTKKNIQIQRINELIELSKKIGIQIDLFLMIFLPGETKESIEKAIDSAKNIDAVIATSIATPIPGTQLWFQGIKEKKLINGGWIECLEKKGQIGNKLTKKEIESLRAKFYLGLAKKKIRQNPRDAIKRIIKNPRKAIDYIKFTLKK